MRLYRLATGAYINLDMVSYIDMYDTYADVYVPGKNLVVHVSDDDYARLLQWLKATADPTNQPLPKNRKNPAAMPDISPTMASPTVARVNGGTT